MLRSVCTFLSNHLGSNQGPRRYKLRALPLSYGWNIENYSIQTMSNLITRITINSQSAHILTALLFVGIAGYEVSVYFGQYWWFLDLFAHMKLQITLVLLLGATGLCFFSRNRLVAGCIFAYLALQVGMTLSTSTFVDTPQDTLDMYFHNTLYYQNKEDYIVQAQNIADAHADVYALVEPHQELITQLTLALGQEPVVYHDEAGLSCAVFTHYPHRVVEHKVLLSSEHDPLCILRFEDYDLIVVHPSPPTQEATFNRQHTYFEQVSALITHAQAQERNWYVVGDFNSTHYSSTFRKYFGEFVSEKIYSWSWPSLITIPIDYAFGSMESTVHRYPRNYSDHHALGVVFTE